MYLRAIRTYEKRMDHHCCKRKATKELLRNYLNVALCAQRGTGRDWRRLKYEIGAVNSTVWRVQSPYLVNVKLITRWGRTSPRDRGSRHRQQRRWQRWRRQRRRRRRWRLLKTSRRIRRRGFDCIWVTFWSWFSITPKFLMTSHILFSETQH